MPQLATEWQQIGPLQWRFKLRPDVKFHDGTPFTADDVVFSINAREGADLADPRLRERGRRAEEDRRLTVEFNLKRSQPDLPGAPEHALHHEQGLVREEQASPSRWTSRTRKRSTARFNANGTGPYMLVSRAPDVKTVYKRNPN